nr:hypothetical protein [Tanacetum cinerariifolium]
VPVTPKVGAAAVSSPAEGLELDTHSSSEADPSESSPPPISVALMVLPFLCLYDSELDTEMLKKHRFRDSILPEDSVEEDINANELADIKDDATAIEVEEGLQDIYEHVMEIPLQRIEDIETRQRELEARSLIAGGERASLLKQVASLERSNVRLRGIIMMESARADRFQRRMSFIESELR